MNKYLIAGLVVVAVVAGAVGSYLVQTPLLGGDFAGGITPSQLFTASTATNSVSPILSNMLVPGAVSAGGVAANNQITVAYTATTSYPTVGSSTLGPVTANTSATTTQVTLIAAGFAVGDACEVAYNAGPTSTAFGADAFVTAVNGGTATATVTFWNGGIATTTLNATSTVTGVSSTLKTTCFHTGV
jgi:hypothetical protein